MLGEGDCSGRRFRQLAGPTPICTPHKQNQPLILGMIMLSLRATRRSCVVNSQMLKLLYPGFAYVVLVVWWRGSLWDGALWVAVRWLLRVRS